MQYATKFSDIIVGVFFQRRILVIFLSQPDFFFSKNFCSLYNVCLEKGLYQRDQSDPIHMYTIYPAVPNPF